MSFCLQNSASYHSIINEIYHSSSFTLLSVTAVSAIWAAGKGFVSIIQGLNDVYDTGGESRNYFILRIHAMLYTIALIVVIIFHWFLWYSETAF